MISLERGLCPSLCKGAKKTTDLITHLQVIFPWHIRIWVRFASTVDGGRLLLQRRGRLIVLRGGPLPVLHLDESGL